MQSRILTLISKGDENQVRQLVSEANINLKNNFLFTFLHVAAGKRKTSIVKFLLEKEADIYAKNTDGQTPLHLAACAVLWATDEIERQEGFDIIKLILQKEAKLNIAEKIKIKEPLSDVKDINEISPKDILSEDKIIYNYFLILEDEIKREYSSRKNEIKIIKEKNNKVSNGNLRSRKTIPKKNESSSINKLISLNFLSTFFSTTSKDQKPLLKQVNSLQNSHAQCSNHAHKD